MFRHGYYFNLEYIYSFLSNEDGENPLDFDALSRSEAEFLTVATDAETGKAVFLPKESITKNNLSAIKASCAMPVACLPYEFNGRKYFDGGVADPIPVEKAFELGCDKVVVIIPRPATKKTREFSFLMKPFLKDYPEVLNLMAHRPEIYNKKLDTLTEYINSGKVILIAPDSDKGLNMITKNKEKLTLYYKKGYEDAKKALHLL